MEISTTGRNRCLVPLELALTQSDLESDACHFAERTKPVRSNRTYMSKEETTSELDIDLEDNEITENLPSESPSEGTSNVTDDSDTVTETEVTVDDEERSNANNV